MTADGDRVASKESVYRGALEKILENVINLAGGRVPGISPDAVLYFEMIRHVCQSALAYEPVPPLAQPPDSGTEE